MPQLPRAELSAGVALRSPDDRHRGPRDARDGARSGCSKPAQSSIGPATTSPSTTATASARSIRLETGWTRIGRSGAADVRLDDPTVSRRHALVVLTDGGDSARARRPQPQRAASSTASGSSGPPLSDGDELEIGRYRLYVLEAYALVAAGVAFRRAGRSASWPVAEGVVPGARLGVWRPIRMLARHASTAIPLGGDCLWHLGRG